jgi:uncharacterized membrane protein
MPLSSAAFVPLGFGLSGYLPTAPLSGERLLAAELNQVVGAVLSSRWAYFFHVPVSLPASFYMRVCWDPRLLKSRQPAKVEVAREGIYDFCRHRIIGAAAWFISLQIFIIRSICPFCMAAHTCGAIIAGLFWFF